MIAAATMLLIAAPMIAQSMVDPRGRSILFVRGAHASGGATEGGTPAQRTEQLGDIFNNATNKGNHGYGTLRALLSFDGFTPTQMIESSTAITLAQLLKHRIVVFGSNNKVYSSKEVQAFHGYIDRGGSALFISDANWGLTWEKAPASDNQFLARYGALVYQDSGHLPTMARTTAGRYLVADHPVLSGPDGIGKKSDVNQYNGEGVSLFRITTGSSGYQAARMVAATGLMVRLNTTSGKAGARRAATANDAAMVFVEKGNARIVGHFDRNTFFNLNGAGTDIHKLNNGQLALNIFRYLASVPARTTAVGAGCGKVTKPRLLVSNPILGRVVYFTLSGATPSAPGWLVFAPGAPQPVGFGNGCTTYVNLTTMQILATLMTSSGGTLSLGLRLPESPLASGMPQTMQALTFAASGPFFSGGELSNGVSLTVGYPR